MRVKKNKVAVIGRKKLEGWKGGEIRRKGDEGEKEKGN